MISDPVYQKPARLFMFLGCFFVTNALLAEFVGVKIFSLETTFGFSPLSLDLFGQTGLSFNLTAGVILWPFVFVMTDIINEYFGRKGVRMMSLIAAGLIIYSFFMITLGINSSPAEFWITSKSAEGIPDYDQAYRAVFGQGRWIIVASLTAFLIGQLLDVTVFRQIKKVTGEKYIWLRATGSTLVSQLVDSFVVLFIAFYIGAGWSFKVVLAIATVNYLYKFSIAVLMTPAIYLIHHQIDKYLGDSLAAEMKSNALKSNH